jgi:RNA-directed DNA polymerase
MNKSKSKNLNGFEEQWKQITWTKAELYVFKLQKRIYFASLGKEIKKVRQLQHTLINSWYAKLVAVKRVTQQNTGKNTAGVDNIKSLCPGSRYVLAQNLKLGTKPAPVRRLWIPQPGTSEKRPLGIPTIKDRALQALVKLALEPEWEAVFEPNSYGFRPGKNAHDAISQIVNSIQQKPKYVLDADIAKCFDRINHESLLKKLGYKGGLHRQILLWLKAGIMENGIRQETDMGTPQGGVLSPLLANVALHGLENRLKDYVATLSIKRSDKLMNTRDKRSSLAVIRYADDFVIMHESKEVLLKCKELLEDWLKPMGLELKTAKTRLTHTLKPELSEDGQAGFNFLGFTVKQFLSKYNSAFSTRGKPLGFKTLVYPSKESCKKHGRTLGSIMRLYQKNTQNTLIQRLNPLIAGWTNYFMISNGYSTRTFHKMDYLLFLKLRSWTRKRSRSKNVRQIKFKYWKHQNNRWEFATKEAKLFTYKDIASGNSITKYVKVRAELSPYDGNELYWATRMGTSLEINPSKAKLLKKQSGKCTLCGQYFRPGDNLETGHVIPKSQGGSNSYTNLQLLHKHCHDQKTGLERRSL